MESLTVMIVSAMGKAAIVVGLVLAGIVVSLLVGVAMAKFILKEIDKYGE